MITLPRIECGGQMLHLHEISLEHALKVARMPERLLEHRLTLFLASVIGNETTARQMTVQERYYVLIQYLAAGDSSNTTTYSGYLLPAITTWQSSVEVHGLMVRQLTGEHVELLEKICQDVADWLTAAMALQCDVLGWPALPEQGCLQSVLDTALRARLELLSKMPVSEVDQLVAIWSLANQQMARYLRTGFDSQGITILSARGADDAPTRFRASAGLGQLVRQLSGLLTENSGAVSA